MRGSSHAGGPPDERQGPVSRVFLGWRRLLTRVLVRRPDGRPGEPGDRRRSRIRPRLIAEYLRDPEACLAVADSSDSKSLRRAGASALVGGIAVATGVGLLTKSTPVAMAVHAAWAVGWALVRWAVLRLALAGDDRREAVSRASMAGLLPFVFAVGFPLDQLAILASWRLTLLGLRGAGVSPRTARTATLLAFGGQLAVEVGAWMARGGVFAVLGRL